MVWFWGWRAQSYRVSKCIFRTNDYYAYVAAHLIDKTTAILRGLELYECLLVVYLLIIVVQGNRPSMLIPTWWLLRIRLKINCSCTVTFLDSLLHSYILVSYLSVIVHNSSSLLGEISQLCDVVYHCFLYFHLAVNVFLRLPLYAAGNNQYVGELSLHVVPVRLWRSCAGISPSLCSFDCWPSFAYLVDNEEQWPSRCWSLPLTGGLFNILTATK